MPLANCTSFGMSTTTGPGRPVVATWNASWMVAASSLTSFTSQLCLVQGLRDADRVAFLEGVGADQRRRHLAGQADERDRIHQRVLQRRHRVGRARSRGHQHDARLAGRARIAFGGMAGALLVADEDVLDVVLLEQLVIDRKDRAARIAEQVQDAVVLQRLHHHLRAGHLEIWHLAPFVLSVAHRPGSVSARRRRNFGSLVLFRAIKKAPGGSLASAHGWISPGGYTALPMRNPTTRMSAVFMGADNRGGVRGKSIAFFAAASRSAAAKRRPMPTVAILARC